MNLHENRELFEQIIQFTSEDLNINASIIEKDYYVTLILKILIKKEPSIVFKGGTSLSKCYKIINRFSEDIDLNYDNGDFKPTQGMRKKFSCTIADVANSHGFELCNPEDIYSKRDFNRFVINFPSKYTIFSLKPHIIVETSVNFRSFPTELLDADSYIYQYLKKHQYKDIIKDYHLTPYKINVQKLERTFIDKIFAICDYHLRNKIREHSRHLYDIYKLYPHITVDDHFKKLILEVRNERKSGKNCLSALPDCNISKILNEIISKDIYIKDYEEITKDLLFENVEYSDVISTLIIIKDLEIF